MATISAMTSGGVRLGEDVMHERHDESGQSVSRARAARVGRLWIRLEPHVRRDYGQALEPLRIVGHQKHCRVDSARSRDERDVPDTDRVENRQGIGRMERKVVAPVGPVAGACASRSYVTTVACDSSAVT